MAASKPLDLKDVDPPIWRIILADKVYGPFTIGQLRRFIQEGRVNARSKIAEGDGGRIQTAGEFPQLASAFAERLERARPRKLNNFVVITHLDHITERFTEALNLLGTFGEAMPGVYLLRSDLRLAEIQSRLSEALMNDDKVMIVDASNERIGWLGLGFDVSDHLRAIWKKAA